MSVEASAGALAAAEFLIEKRTKGPHVFGSAALLKKDAFATVDEMQVHHRMKQHASSISIG